MLFRAFKFPALLKFNVKPVNSIIGRYNFSSSPTRRKRKTNSRRSTHYTMLDKFINQTSPDGSLIVKAPMNLKCSASYFDQDNQVDTNKNVKISQSRQEANKIERLNRRNRVHEYVEAEEDFQEERRDPDNGAGIFMQSEHLASIRDISDVERNFLQSIVDKNMEQGSADSGVRAQSRSPLQVSLWGRPMHRVDSYSIVSGSLTHTHMYVSDASTGEEAISMFSMESEGGNTVTPPTGQVDIWRPREVSQVEITSGMFDDSIRDEVVSRFKIHSPPHLLRQENNGISMNFRTPILMNQIFLEAMGLSTIDLNGVLMDQLVTVGLVTEAGNIKISDIWAEYIKLASNSGDVMCYGTLEGNVRAETLGDGDFTARSVVGPRLDVVTDRGDICVWDDCHSETAQLFTNFGNVTCNRLYSDAKICIKKEGVATLNIISGSVGCVVRNGDIISHIDELTQDSFLEVETGNVIIHIPAQSSRNFRVSLVSPRSQISPHVLNSGEFYVKDGLEYFVTGGKADSGDMAPCLTVRVREGSVSLLSPAMSRSVDTGDESGGAS